MTASGVQRRASLAERLHKDGACLPLFGIIQICGGLLALVATLLFFLVPGHEELGATPASVQSDSGDW